VIIQQLEIPLRYNYEFHCWIFC